MGFPAASVLALAIAAIAGASRAEGVDFEANCLLACASQYKVCITAQTTTQGACMAQNEVCQKVCKAKKN
jgi:hypothetical protein